MNLPSAIVTESARQKFAVMLSDMRAQGTPDSDLKQMVSPEGFQKFLGVVKPKVEEELRGRLAVESIAKLASIEVDQQAADEQMEYVKRQFEQQQQEGQSFNPEKAREKVESELLRIEVLDHVTTKAKVTYVDKVEEKGDVNDLVAN